MAVYKKLIHNNEIFMFPSNTYAIMSGDRLAVYVNDIEVENINKNKISRERADKVKDFVYLLPIYSAHNFLSEQYSNIATFLKANKDMTYLYFDSKTSEDIILFSFLPKLDFAVLDGILERIIKTMPFILNIFIRPVIHLTAEEIILPVDSVKKISRNTIQHMFRHSENWENVTDGKIKPSKLLTKVYEDDYTIYENKVFCRTVDHVITLLKNYKNIFTDIIYNKITFELNMMDKSNHLYHYLALGKLYVGFVKSDELFAEKCDNYVQQFDKLIGKISANKVRTVYKKNKDAKLGRTIAKTNILAMHKDYRHIYTLKTMLDKSEEIINWKKVKKNINSLQVNYQNFCNMLIAFSIEHFRFTTSNAQIYSNSEFLGADFIFSKWKVNLTPTSVKCLGVSAVMMTVSTADKSVTTMLIPMITPLSKSNEFFINEALSQIAAEYNADKYVFLCAMKSNELPTYYSTTPINYGIIPASINDVNSFKRIQKLLLQAMIDSSEEYDLCPFCGGDFTFDGEKFYCKKCKTEICENRCDMCGRPYVYSSVNYPALKKKVVDIRNYNAENLWKYFNDKDSQHNYRNITDIDIFGKPVCPHCNAKAAQV